MKDKHTITTVQPTQCHLWQHDIIDEPTQGSISDSFECMEVYLDDDHEKRKLLKCEQCQQLYYYEFYEMIDWVNGNDPQYRTWVPVATKEDADALALCPPHELLAYYPRLQNDWPANAERPHSWWNRDTHTPRPTLL